MAALAPAQPAPLTLGLHPQGLTDHGRAARGIGAVRGHGVHPANRDLSIDVARRRDERLILAVIDHELESNPSGSENTRDQPPDR